MAVLVRTLPLEDSVQWTPSADPRLVSVKANNAFSVVTSLADWCVMPILRFVTPRRVVVWSSMGLAQWILNARLRRVCANKASVWVAVLSLAGFNAWAAWSAI